MAAVKYAESLGFESRYRRFFQGWTFSKMNSRVSTLGNFGIYLLRPFTVPFYFRTMLFVLWCSNRWLRSPRLSTLFMLSQNQQVQSADFPDAWEFASKLADRFWTPRPARTPFQRHVGGGKVEKVEKSTMSEQSASGEARTRVGVKITLDWWWKFARTRRWVGGFVMSAADECHWGGWGGW